MKIAVTYQDGMIFQHFGHTQQFKLYDVAEGVIKGQKIVDVQGSGHGALAGFLTEYGVDTLLCGGIGGGAQSALAAARIQLYGGISGDADEAVRAFLSGTLAYDPDVHCNHHEHGRNHSCGGHTCEGAGHDCHGDGEHCER